MTKPRKPRTDEELQAAVGHVGYELTTMVDCACSLSELSNTESLSDAKRVVVLLESCLTHARSLIEFLAEWPDGGTISPKDYMPGWTPAKGYDAARQELNNWLSHLSWQRVEYSEPVGGKAWDPDPLVQQLVADFRDFVGDLPEDRRAWFAGPLRQVTMRTASVSAKAAMTARSYTTSTEGETTVVVTPPR